MNIRLARWIAHQLSEPVKAIDGKARCPLCETIGRVGSTNTKESEVVRYCKCPECSVSFVSVEPIIIESCVEITNIVTLAPEKLIIGGERPAKNDNRSNPINGNAGATKRRSRRSKSRN